MKKLILIVALMVHGSAAAQTWRADNGNGTFTNPLFYDEFSDLDLIRVGEDYYLTGTTMHSMPGLPVLHSRDLVNWKLLGYALDRLDLGPEFRLEDGKEAYGQGIWAPSFRYHNGLSTSCGYRKSRQGLITPKFLFHQSLQTQCVR